MYVHGINKVPTKRMIWVYLRPCPTIGLIEIIGYFSKPLNVGQTLTIVLLKPGVRGKRKIG